MTQVKTRYGVFETNSSSTHSLTLSPTMENMVKSPVSDYEIKNGFVEIRPSDYGWEVESYSNIHDKASYLYVDAMTGEDSSNVDPNDDFYRNRNFKLKMIVDAFKEYTGLDVKFKTSSDKYNPFGYIDHQSHGLCNEVFEEGTNGVIRFIFSENSYFQTDNDNH